MNVLLGVTGCIGAYKAAEVLRVLQKAGARVRVVMTKHATEFISPATFEALSGSAVITGMFEQTDHTSIQHIAAARESDLLLVAPATANILAKFAHGIADDFLSTLYLSNTNPVLIAPAMNVEMWNHPATQANLKTLRERGNYFVEPGVGYQACGEIGVGRLAEPEEIVAATLRLLSARNPQSKDFAAEHVLITAGPTVEDLDPVRFITNRSSGKMGYAMAEAARDRGARVTLISGPTKLAAPAGIETVQVRSTRDMFEAVMNRLPDATIFIGCAAVADFRPAARAEHKIKKQGRANITLELEPTEDIIAAVAAAPNRNSRIVAGFAAESQTLLDYAEKKLREKGLDLIVANDIKRTDAGFDVDTNLATILKRDGRRVELPLQNKRAMADRVLDEILRLKPEKVS
ncbi:MAG TPA: bifunctional phosphopantothenoylcysteine decarboxylase/phosphopantothenate--cysteine ligase CoaBC [Blastocatellia bacterium]|nr:bifunctional phosphopantothenoylcysteine decarboxylase/phosphopantothenate--cysteine ligase CoaBC [Blastocatellia bacterium]HMV87018.1 bifunctional phosphopantothenoylcysteine decarboxylase/phosphopantothenate--cysteine ligase CoaBC [Blastocatellia bacterium]HMX25154.1 bifunctional phosphopantothenoylcysteine decarboxylase/phosphopantothenate--cysteine ligase CoaBC [Blastocatellia bacterium]HMY76229.1 bifunctional phosphopantothenoylcysteine decarboxylase/phosphopantothenate--cysteine ligase 